MRVFDGKRVLVTGGTGSLGKVLVRRLLSGDSGDPAKVIVFSAISATFMRWQRLFKAWILCSTPLP
jgi:UDP-glucose 4-epimerase